MRDFDDILFICRIRSQQHVLTPSTSRVDGKSELDEMRKEFEEKWKKQERIIVEQSRMIRELSRSVNGLIECVNEVQFAFVEVLIQDFTRGDNNEKSYDLE